MAKGSNRFSGFRQGVRTVEIETVLRFRPAQNTPLKQGVNETMRSNNHLVCEMFRLGLLGSGLGRSGTGMQVLDDSLGSTAHVKFFVDSPQMHANGFVADA